MSTITSPPELFTEGVRALSEAIIKPVYDHPELTTFCTTYTGIKHDTQIVIVDGEIEGLSGKKKENCDKTPANLSWGHTEKLWSVKEHKDRIAECYDTLKLAFYKYSLKPGMEAEDLTATDWAEFLAVHFPKHLRKMWNLKAWFSKTDIAHGTNNSIGVGNEDYLNQNEGWWEQLFDIHGTTVGAARLTVDSTLQGLNAAGSFSAQKFTATHTTNQLVTGILDQMYYDAVTELTADKTGLMYLVSRSVYNQYERERKKLASSGIELAYMRMENGVGALKCNDIPVIPMDSWDKILRKYFGQDDTNVATFLPHRALLTKKTMLALGTEDENSMKQFLPFYDRVSGNNYIDYASNIDFKFLIDEQHQAAY